MSNQELSDFDWFEADAQKPASKRVLIIEDDPSFAEILASYIDDWGDFKIDLAAEGGAAWRLIEDVCYELVVLDWRLPKVSGVIIFNRLRSHPDYEATPVLVSSGLLDATDVRLLQEYSCTRAVTKPYTREIFIEAADALFKEQKWYVENWLKFDHAIKTIEEGKPGGVQEILRILADNHGSVAAVINAARALTKVREWEAAKKILISLVKADTNNVVALYELGKIFYLTKDFDAATKTLAKAQKLSPKNMSRERLIGEVALNAGDMQVAAQHFKKAVTFDGQDAKAHAGNDLAGEIMALGLPESGRLQNSLASMLNLTGVGLVKAGKFDEAIDKYQRALEFLADRIDQGRVLFNVGLACKRAGRISEALKAFKQADALAGSHVPKIRQYLETGASDTEACDNLDLVIETPSPKSPQPSSRPSLTPQASRFTVPSPPEIIDVGTILKRLSELEQARDSEQQRLSEAATELGKIRLTVFNADEPVIRRFESQVEPLKIGAMQCYSDPAVYNAVSQFKPPSLHVVWMGEKYREATCGLIEEILDGGTPSQYAPLLVYADGEAAKTALSTFMPPLRADLCKVVEWKRDAFAKDFVVARQQGLTGQLASLCNSRNYSRGNQNSKSLSDKEISDYAASQDPAVRYRGQCLQLEMLIAGAHWDKAEKLSAILCRDFPSGFASQALRATVLRQKEQHAALLDAAALLAKQSRLSTTRAFELGKRLAHTDTVDRLEAFLQAWVEGWRLPLDGNFYGLSSLYFAVLQQTELQLSALAYSLSKGFLYPEMIAQFKQHAANGKRAG